MPDIVAICDAIATELNKGSFAQPFTAVRNLLPEFDLSDLADLKVTVVPKGIETSTYSRESTQYDFVIDIGIQKKLSGEVNQDLPAMLALVDEIMIFLRKRKLASMPQVGWVKCTSDPIYARDHLVQTRVFTSVLTVTYRAMSA
ncbi:MAG: hypothetical protein A2Y07_06905 [Planctomycetes bacterium GWF2_50_10]|nr:MAG: hypothetical protein A2Y07_06905 [Planctomycetes bacterium GWF2_50_10]